MNWLQILNYILFVVLPVLFALGYYIVRLPEMQRSALWLYAKIAVQQVEQEHKGKDTSSQSRDELNMAKKEIAVTIIVARFRAYFFFPVPSREQIESAIEAAVYELAKTQKKQ